MQKRAVVVTFWLGLSCSNTEFSGNDRKQGAEPKVPIPEEVAFNVSCTDTNTTGVIKKDISGSSKTSLIIKGEFCQEAAQDVDENELTVLFLIDFSGSMRDNDGVVGDTCGRFDAAKAIVGKLESSVAKQAKVEATILAFGNQAENPKPPTSLADFAEDLEPDEFCGEYLGGTNYQAAFSGAKDLLAGRSGRKVIYFISDGLPTLGGVGGLPTADAYGSGRDAAKELRDEVDDVILNAIYIGSNDPGIEVGVEDPEEYLASITGDKDKVKVVREADDLAKEIIKFETPEVVGLDRDSFVGDLSVVGVTEEVSIKSFRKDSARESVWTFATDPIELKGELGEETLNQITFSVQSTDGTLHQIKVKVYFSPED